MTALLSLRSPRRQNKGFTLIELAIALGVIGVLSAGAWKLMSAGSQQVKDQSAAQQQAALIESVRNYLADTSDDGGQKLLTQMAANETAQIPLPSSNGSVANCQANIAAPRATSTVLVSVTARALCTYLPTGFTASTTNAFGQTFGSANNAAIGYGIRVKKDNTAAGTAPISYSFMIYTSSARAIPDVDGGRISGLIGSDGGFVYTSTAICGSTSPISCGALGAWSSNVISDFGYNAASSGRIASRTFVSGGVASNYFWLARVAIPGDTGYVYNTMATDFYLGTNASTPNTIHLGNGYVIGDGGSTGAQIDLSVDGTTSDNALISLTTQCTALGPTYCHSSNTRAINVVVGDVGVGGQLTVTKIYSSSDARLKTDIRPIHGALSDLMKIEPVSFAFKAGGSKSMGVTAQNLEKVYPQLVTETDGKKYVDYSGLTGPMLAAIQELKKENDELRAQLHEQAQRQEKLERKIDAKAP